MAPILHHGIRHIQQEEVMATSRISMFAGALALAGANLFGANGVGALTMQECSAKYKSARSAGTLNGKTTLCTMQLRESI